MSENDNQLIVQRRLAASRERVFRALTDPVVMQRWFFAGAGWTAVVTNQFSVGGRYQIDMHDEDGNRLRHTGEYRQITPPAMLAFTWNSPGVRDTLVTIHLAETADGTDLTLIHDFLPDRTSQQNHEAGWHACFNHLDKTLQTANTAT